MKVLKKLLALTSICLSFFLLCQATTLVVAAAEPISVPEVTYQLDNDGNVVEDVYYHNVDGLSLAIQRIIYPDNTSKILAKYGDHVEILMGTANFDMFKQLADSCATPYDISEVARIDIHGPNFQHLLMGTVSDTYEKNAVQEFLIGGTTTIIIYLTVSGIPGLVVGLLASLVFALASANTPAKVVVSTTSYEVRTLDGGYYTHCYHYQATIYDDGGHYIGSDSGTYERIGG